MNWTNQPGAVSGIWGNGAAIFAGTAGVVTLGDHIAFTSLQFSTTGYVVKGAGFNLLPTGTATITTDAGVRATIAAPLTGAGGS